jgi:hypothetical protein
VKAVTKFLGAKSLYIIVVITSAQNYYTEGADKWKFLLNPRHMNGDKMI